MDTIFKYWMDIAKEAAQKSTSKKENLWEWEKHQEDIGQLKDKFGNDYLTILGIRISLDTGELEDLLADNEGDKRYYTPYLFHYSKAKDVGTSDHWVKYYDLMEGLPKGIEPFANNVNEIRILLDNSEEKVIKIIEDIGGIKTTHRDLSWIICPLPNIQILFIYHRGCEEFQSALNVLFDKNTIYYLPPELIWASVAIIADRINSLIK